jgi:hypothetical protein
MVRGSSQGVGAMGFFNVIITLGVGLVMLFGAAITYKNRMA